MHDINGNNSDFTEIYEYHLQKTFFCIAHALQSWSGELSMSLTIGCIARALQVSTRLVTNPIVKLSHTIVSRAVRESQ